MELPLEDAGLGGGGFGLGNVPGGLEGDGKGGVGEGVGGGEGGEGEGGADGLLERASIAEGADETVVGFEVVRIGCDGGAEGPGSAGGVTGGEQGDACFKVRIGGGVVGGGHGCL